MASLDLAKQRLDRANARVSSLQKNMRHFSFKDRKSARYRQAKQAISDAQLEAKLAQEAYDQARIEDVEKQKPPEPMMPQDPTPIAPGMGGGPSMPSQPPTMPGQPAQPPQMQLPGGGQAPDWLGHVSKPVDSLLPQQLERSGPIAPVTNVRDLMYNPINYMMNPQGAQPGPAEMATALRSGGPV